MMDEKIKNLIKRVDQKGIVITEPDRKYQSLSKKEKYLIFNNRHKQKTIIIDKKQMKKLYGIKL